VGVEFPADAFFVTVLLAFCVRVACLEFIHLLFLQQVEELADCGLHHFFGMFFEKCDFSNPSRFFFVNFGKVALEIQFLKNIGLFFDHSVDAEYSSGDYFAVVLARDQLVDDRQNHSLAFLPVAGLISDFHDAAQNRAQLARVLVDEFTQETQQARNCA